MKIALCYSGRPRNILECHDNHKEHFGLGSDNVDVFAHLWFDDSLVGSKFRSDAGQGNWPDAEIKDWIEENWKPKKVKYEEPRVFEHMFNDTWDPKWHGSHPKDNQISMFYGIEEVMKLKREYEEEQGFEYDLVVRMRSDLNFIQSPGDLSEYDPNKLHVYNMIAGDDWIQTGVDEWGILDIVAWGGSKIMDKYSTTYSNLERILSEGCPAFTPDSLLGYNSVKVNNLPLEKHSWVFKIFVGNHIYS